MCGTSLNVMALLLLILFSFVSVGEPIEVSKKENPTKEEIEDLHSKYIEALQKLFEDHKEKYEPNEDVKLEIF